MSAVRRPASETGIYLHRHEHRWIEGGTHVWPSGDEDPLWKCSRCGDVICGPAAATRPADLNISTPEFQSDQGNDIPPLDHPNGRSEQ